MPAISIEFLNLMFFTVSTIFHKTPFPVFYLGVRLPFEHDTNDWFQLADRLCWLSVAVHKSSVYTVNKEVDKFKKKNYRPLGSARH